MLVNLHTFYFKPNSVWVTCGVLVHFGLAELWYVYVFQLGTNQGFSLSCCLDQKETGRGMHLDDKYNITEILIGSPQAEGMGNSVGRARNSW